ncbi:hypothetical protein [Kitasatospora sp. NE20-6]|uniref:hypothetical protein n=1 Tax=Kitasatospora sp. NE20-6 TaxID=2859066 RepID=UPI0038B2D21A
MTETAVLPHMEGPPLVRPYVPAASGYAGAPAGPGPDPFGTALMPPVPGSHPRPPARPPMPPTAGRDARPGAAPGGPAGPDLGVFAFQGVPPQRPGGRADRREQAQLTAGRRRTAVVAAGIGIAIVGAGLAFVLAPSSEPSEVDQALPVPSGSIDAPAPTGPAETAPTATASPSASRRASATATRGASASASAGRAPSSVPSASAPAVAPSGPPAASSPAPATAAPRTLKPGDTGADVRTMQQMLYSVDCGRNHLNSWFVSGTFDTWTQWVLGQFQVEHRIKGDERNGTLYGPKTQAELQKAASDPDC